MGSPFGDDQVGWRVAEHLADALAPSRANVLLRDRPGPALLNDLAGTSAALLIDAGATGDEPGTIHALSSHEAETPGPLWSSHGLDLGETLALGRALEVLPRRLELYLISIEPRQALEPGAALTPAVAAAARELTEYLADRLRATP